MFCSQCGYMLDEADKFCPKCGAPVKAERAQREAGYEDIDYGGFEDEPYDFSETDDGRRPTRTSEKNGGRMPGEDKNQPDKTEKQKNKTEKQKKYVMILCSVFAVSALLIIAGFVGFSIYKNHRLSNLKEAYTAYEQVMDEYMIEDEVYKTLLARAQNAIQNKDISEAKVIENELKEAREAIEASSESREKLSALKTEYTEIFSKYRISGEYKEDYDTVMKSLDDAIAAADEKQFSALKKQLESLKINLNTANQQEVTNIKNEITALDVSDADGDDAKLLKDYEAQAEAALAEKNYAAALDILEVWKNDAGRIAEKIKKERESKAESMKAEQERLESESRAAESEKEALSGDYILPESNTRLLTEGDLEGLSAHELMLARNEIYARHGRKFIDEQIQAYFNGKSWYNGTIEAADFDSSVLSEIERANISFIGAHE